MMADLSEAERVTHREGGIAAYMRHVRAVAEKDIRAEMRSKEVVGTMAAFSILSAVVFGLAFDLRVPRPALVVPGILWVIVLFAGVLGLHRSFGSEVDHGTLAGLLLAPVERSAIYLGKVAANLVYFLIVEALLVPAFLILFDVNLLKPIVLLGLLLGTIGYVGIGTVFAALTSRNRARETLLPVLLLPVLAPLFIAGVGLTSVIVDGRAVSEAWPWLGIIGLYDTLTFAVAFLLVDVVWESS
ncbi:MAG: heme exporter protein CcmB [Caldilineaceae bacterium]|nr:heme exporter protein CcmB [Caldilineaceae bacterium]